MLKGPTTTIDSFYPIYPINNQTIKSLPLINKIPISWINLLCHLFLQLCNPGPLRTILVRVKILAPIIFVAHPGLGF